MKKKLYKSTSDRKLAGICAGIADYFNIDVTFIRLFVAVVSVFAGIVPALIAYLIASFIIPDEPEGNNDNIIDM